jgi:hypothetical protein
MPWEPLPRPVATAPVASGPRIPLVYRRAAAAASARRATAPLTAPAAPAGPASPVAMTPEEMTAHG